MLSVQNISFSYQKEATLKELSFSVARGSTMAVIGASGCGKSTLLKLLYGLHDLDAGQIFWNELEVLGPKYHLIPGMDYMKYLAQDFDLMPYITVAENVGKYLSNFYPEQKAARVAELLAIVEMTEFAGVKAQYLSGGQMQRVAIARVLALEPEVLLLDEPFSHIDNFRKNSLRRKLFRYLKEQGITTIVATHDSTDVLSFAEDVLVMQGGRIIAQGAPAALYSRPQDYYVASLFGDVNEIALEGKVHYVYPHQLKVVNQSPLAVTVKQVHYRGSHYLVEGVYEGAVLYFESAELLQEGVLVCLHFDAL
jgi:ABC-type sulfate/molybdate transport systems ATPase subunit